MIFFNPLPETEISKQSSSPHNLHPSGKLTFSAKISTLIICLCFFLYSPIVNGAEITLSLTGNIEFPGIMSLKSDFIKFDHICFLGEGTPGSLDTGYLSLLSQHGIPEGDFEISPALRGEKWPTLGFSRNGALRFFPVSKNATTHASLRKNGLAVHGRDFYPLAERLTANPKMVRFISDKLFEELSKAWGTLRISNWDMGRLYDFYSENVARPKEWTVKVVAVNSQKIKKICEPLKVRRKPGGPLE